MGGFFGILSRDNCARDLFYGTDYHSHLGTKRGGMSVLNAGRFTRFIHNIENAQFRSKFEQDLKMLKGNKGIGVISDTDDQPLIIRSHLGIYSLVTVGVVKNAEELAREVEAIGLPKEKLCTYCWDGAESVAWNSKYMI